MALKDQIIALKGQHKGMQLRRVEALVEVDGKWWVMVFITNHLAWSPRSVCDLYRRHAIRIVGASRPARSVEILWDGSGLE
jgi:hypothetical protein